VKQDEVIKPKINEIWQNNYKVYGATRLRVALRSTYGIKFGTRRVKGLMTELNIHSLMIRRFKKPGTHVDYGQNPNLINKLTRSKFVWRADITYLELKPGTCVYLSTVFDDQSANVLADNISKSMTSELVKSTIIDALRLKRKPKYLHSDIPVLSLKMFLRLIIFVQKGASIR
jgi:putative transposase